MKKLLPMLVLVLLLAGCPMRSPSRLDVTLRLRRACPRANDTGILAFINIVEMARQDGMTRAQTNSILASECLSTPGIAFDPCFACSETIISQVYGF